MKNNDGKKEQPRVEKPPTADEFAALKQKAAERDEYCDKYLRLLAEYDNAKKRFEREREGHIKFANEDIMAQLFPIVDNFDMALAAMEKAPPPQGAADKSREAVMEGIKMVQKEFHRVLDENGVKKIKTEGQKFDPAKHEALETVEGDASKDGMIAEELQPGYELNGLVIRAAKVRVIKCQQTPPR